MTRFLFLLLAVFSFSSVHADDSGLLIGLAAIFSIGLISIFIIILGSLVKIGFVRHFTRVRKKNAITVAIMMNVISLIMGLPVSYMVLRRIFDSSSYLITIFGCLFLYIFIVFLNTWIEGEIIEVKLDQPSSKTYRWLSAANSFSIGISVFFARLFVHL